MAHILSLTEAVRDLIHNGDTVALEGFTHLIPYAAGHEIIRQRKRGLTLVRMTPDIIADQLVAAGVVDRMVFGFTGNSAVGSLHSIRRAIEKDGSLEIEEYSHYGLLGRYLAGASDLPFYPLGSYAGGDLTTVNPLIRKVTSPYQTGDDVEEVYVVPPIRPDVAIIHAQRADRDGNVQVWGIVGPQQEVVFASRRSIVLVEEIVEPEVVRSDPNRTVLPSFTVDAIVQCPRGAHPSYVQGYYDRDNDFYSHWSTISKDPELLDRWIQEWVHDVPDHAAYLEKLGANHFDDLTPVPAPSAPVDYGSTL
ncbi:CoA transferase subunit A [Rhodococcus sp. NPDC057014]|uniref:CoA transferase subunit A n=1 Tax=Rhodococcus sp. NPDC057014 TaxID=3346000 RepID=UPI00363986EF